VARMPLLLAVAAVVVDFEIAAVVVVVVDTDKATVVVVDREH